MSQAGTTADHPDCLRSSTWTGGYGCSSPPGGTPTQRADTVSLLAAAALGHHPDEGFGATHSPRNVDYAGHHRTERPDALSCNSIGTEGTSSADARGSRRPSALKCSINGQSRRRSRGSRISWHDQDSSEKCEATGSSPSSARKTEQTKAEPAPSVQDVREQRWTIYQDFSAMGEALRDFSNVVECFCGNRTQPQWDAYIESASRTDSSGSHPHMRATGSSEICIPMTPTALKERPQLDGESSNKWFECASTNLERAASAPAATQRPDLDTPAVAARLSLNTTRTNPGQRPRFLPEWTDHICYNSEHYLHWKEKTT